jgi:hypothetical protein
MTNPGRVPWLFAALVCLAGCGASAAEPAAGRTDPAAEKSQLKVEIAPAPAPKREAERAPAAKPPEKPEAAAEAGKPARKPDSLVEFEQTPASQVLAFVAEYAKVNIITDPDCAEKLKAPVSFRARGMTYRQVLEWALRLSGTDWTLTNGAIYVTSPEKLPKQANVIETVRKLLVENPGFGREPAQFDPPPELGLPERK